MQFDVRLNCTIKIQRAKNKTDVNYFDLGYNESKTQLWPEGPCRVITFNEFDFLRVTLRNKKKFTPKNTYYVLEVAMIFIRNDCGRQIEELMREFCEKFLRSTL